ncbi:hypothetical protein AAZX31_08G230300 [Glycine max]|uniref:Knottin scorpion toxin-like domain-containing protein n=2 Tax=Glycine subgen. Soja TaxID=1462606 RepID=K7L8C8_SOYBN|nr:hypothetical protein JHK87_022122 [Glycine soja]KAG5016551.1 hypothetical protein JHK85_022687 [Glycine max]KAG5026311.1 hypothetical protein JHK86_022225 [Glycine max]KAG5137471.1 hypothetical protein JHK82_022202 [Glycine max]KAH1052716.1 hypothetical protein GYH30_022162 [Glycine max]
MKAITIILIVLLVLSVGIENEGPLKVIEARTCQDRLGALNCIQDECHISCIKKHGKLTKVGCSMPLYDCICLYPC